MDFIKTPEQGKEMNILKLFFLFNSIPFFPSSQTRVKAMLSLYVA